MLGEGKETLGELVERLHQGRDIQDLDGLAFMKDGEPHRNCDNNLIADLDTLPFPGYDMPPIEVYIRARNPHGAARGRWLPLIQKDLDLDVLVAACKRAIKKDMVVCCFFIVGFPHETMEDIKETFRFLRWLARIGVHEISITAFTALPGSALFRELMEAGRIKLDDQFFRELLYMSDLSWAPSWVPGMTDEQIASLRRRGYLQFFLISYLYHPGRIFTTAFNIMRGIETTKVERVAHEKLRSAGMMFTRFFRKRRIAKAKPAMTEVPVGAS